MILDWIYRTVCVVIATPKEEMRNEFPDVKSVKLIPSLTPHIILSCTWSVRLSRYNRFEGSYQRNQPAFLCLVCPWIPNIYNRYDVYVREHAGRGFGSSSDMSGWFAVTSWQKLRDENALLFRGRITYELACPHSSNKWSTMPAGIGKVINCVTCSAQSRESTRRV